MGSNSLSRLLGDGDVLLIVQIKRQGKTLRLISGDSTPVTSKQSCGSLCLEVETVQVSDCKII